MDGKRPEEAASAGVRSAVQGEEYAADDNVPDPDEDDLDDLDDFLDDFSAAKIDAQAPAPPSGPGRPTDAASGTSANTSATPTAGTAPAAGGDSKAETAAGTDEPNLEDLLGDDEFAKQLQAGMADLLGEIENSPDMQAQLESFFKELGGEVSNADAATAAATATATTGAAASAAAAPGPSVPRGAAASADASFQDTIRRTMERMQESGDQATAAAAADSSSTDDMLSEFMKQMQSGGLGGGASEEELSKMLVGMMEELTNKEILYEPMKELHDKFPAWLEENRAKTPADDLKRYEEQQGLVREIVTRFELATYSDANAADREYIVDRMQKMQAAGSPPPDLVGDMPSAQEALAMPDESCNPQ